MNRNEDIVNEKLSERSKSKKRKADKKKHKKHKKHKKKKKTSVSSSSSESSDDIEHQWVEKNVEEEIVNKSKALENQLVRDEWMNEENYVPWISKSNIGKEKSDVREEEKTKIDLSKPGQSNKELNPYWKDGGDGLPKNSSEIQNTSQVLDAEWLKKSLRRAQEQALRDGKSLEEVAAERWGSLETIQSMIATAEKASNTKQDKVYKRYYNDRSNRDKREKSFSCRSYSRSRSRSPKSKIREYSGKHSTSISSHHAEQKRIYQRPKDDNNLHQSTHRSTSSTKNWKKNKDNETNCEHEKSKPEVKEVDVQQISNIHESDTNKSVTEIDMNK